MDNGDGSVSPDGTQLKPLPSATPSPAPVCDVIANYGWSMQVDDASQCTAGSRMCEDSAACCPNELVCGEIGPSQVQPCCPKENPNCRGDVNGLAVQVCADSSWSLWHVNTNGNHFCCLPGKVGYNVPNDQAATGFCGDVVPGGTMRSILVSLSTATRYALLTQRFRTIPGTSRTQAHTSTFHATRRPNQTTRYRT